ncbi:hypothetical protein AX15_002263 [Amanita polypyramis BW_CC]|nr:hypothetical protein AX15_002263 [Amanita polypyramis BW_CC]
MLSSKLSTRHILSRFLSAREFSATLPARARNQENNDATPEKESQLPRYLRRQLSFGHAATSGSAKPTSKEPEVFRSRHYDPSEATHASKSTMKLLEPHVLSSRLKKLCNANQLDAAVSMLKNAPLDAQNAPVWNTLIWEAMKARRFKVAYQLYVDMKRRGHTPTARTFQTMFNGLSRIEDWSIHMKQLANARSLYEAFQKHMASIKRAEPDSPQLSVDPLAAYIKILGDAGCYQDIFDVYYAMDADGPLAPNKLIFAAIFQALSPKPEVAGDSSVSYLKTAADAKLLWKQMVKLSRRSPDFQVDSFIATAAVSALTRGGPSEQSLAFEIAKDYFGLYPPEDSAPTAFLPLQPASLDVILRLCNYTQKHDLCLEFVQQVKRRPEEVGGPSVLDRGHMEEVIKAHLALSGGNLKYDAGYQALRTVEYMLRQEIVGKNGPRIRPTITTFNLVMTSCWRSGDWRSAVRTFELMTGYHAHDFLDGAVGEIHRVDKRSPDRYFFPTPQIASSMVRTALGSGDRANMRQCLRIIHHLGLDAIVGCKTDGAESKKATRSRAFYTSKLNQAILEIVESVRGDRDIPEEAKKWKGLSSRAMQLEGTSRASGEFFSYRGKDFAE